MGKMGLFDLEKHFAFYGAYHSNPVNIFIHMLFVWPIFFTSLVLFFFTPSICHLGPFAFCPFRCSQGLAVNFGFFFALIYALFYICLDKKAGSLAALLCFGCWVSSNFLGSYLGFSLAWKVVLAAQLFCWTGQFIGHGVFEKRAPALLDNLVQAFLMAPFFVLLEALQTFFGYEPYPGFHARVKAKVDAEIKEWKDRKQKKIS
uniref:Endoplasmic reticulum membrane protein C16E8.02 n=1 Tax=Davidia involucrata TaxID=16924 RepID=A0A5B6YN95_DAVIN